MCIRDSCLGRTQKGAKKNKQIYSVYRELRVDNSNSYLAAMMKTIDVWKYGIVMSNFVAWRGFNPSYFKIFPMILLGTRSLWLEEDIHSI